MVNDDILQLYIPMSNVPFMQVLKRHEQLLDESLGLLFWKLSIGHRLQMGVQALSSGVFHDKVDILWRINALMQLDDIWMIELLKNFDFRKKSIPILDPAPSNGLTSSDLFGIPMSHLLDFTIGVNIVILFLS